MLVIARKDGQSVLIGDDIEIKILKQFDGTVKLGIEAPKDKLILRKELYEEVGKENRKASSVDLELIKNLKL